MTGEGGSGYIRKIVLRKALEAEVAAIRAGDPAKAAITERNYTFLMSDSADDGTVKVRIEPRRLDVLLVSGFISLIRDDGDLVQIEGRLSKSPSFWTRTVDVIRRYSPPQWRPRPDTHGKHRQRANRLPIRVSS